MRFILNWRFFICFAVFPAIFIVFSHRFVLSLICCKVRHFVNYTLLIFFVEKEKSSILKQFFLVFAVFIFSLPSMTCLFFFEHFNTVFAQRIFWLYVPL